MEHEIENAPARKTGSGNPYRIFMWGGLIMAVLCFGLAAHRFVHKRPARSDAYTIAGILGLMSAAMAWSLGAAHERSRKSQQSLQESLDRLQDRMHDMPRSLMEESVKIAERERAERRGDQERQARELREALEGGIKVGFAPLAPALSERIESSLSGLSDALRQDREERATSLRETAQAVAALQAAQKEWAQASSSLLRTLGDQGAALQREISERDASGRIAWQELSASSTQGFQAASDLQLEKVRGLVEGLTSKWEASQRSQQENMSAEWKVALEQSRAQLTEGSEALLRGMSAGSESLRQGLAENSEAMQKGLSAGTEALLSGLAAARESVTALGADAGEKLRGNAEQAEAWLQGLASAAGKMEEAAQGAQRSGQDSAALQSEWRATVETFHQGLGGMLERLQSFASLAQGQEAVLAKMEAAIRRFEERSAELLEETALKAQESLLDALDQSGARASREA